MTKETSLQMGPNVVAKTFFLLPSVRNHLRVCVILGRQHTQGCIWVNLHFVVSRIETFSVKFPETSHNSQPSST